MKITKLTLLMVLAFAPWLTASAQTLVNGSFEGAVDPYPISSIRSNQLFPAAGWTDTGFQGYAGLGQWDTATPPARGNFNPNYNLDVFDAWAPMGSSSDGGLYMVFRTAPGYLPITILQDITGFSPNSTYAVTFQVANMFVGRMDDGASPFITNNDAMMAQDGHFDVSLTGTLEGTLSTMVFDYPAQTDPDLSVLAPWTTVTLTFTTDSSVTPSDALSLSFAHMLDPDIFVGDNPNTFGGQLALDGVSITLVPEPGSMGMLALALGAGVLRRHRARPV